MTGQSGEFERFGAEWWNPAGRLFSLHMINPLRFEYFASKAGGLSGKRVLDVGCGGGLLSEKFAEKGAAVTGIDLSPAAIEAAKRHSIEMKLDITYRLVSSKELCGENPDPFDIVICAEVLEHVDGLRAMLRDALKMLSGEGLFFFSTINRTMKARLLALVVAEDILHMVPKGTHDYRRFVRPSELTGILAENGVRMREIKGMTYDPLRLEFRISNDPSVNYLGYAVKDL